MSASTTIENGPAGRKRKSAESRSEGGEEVGELFRRLHQGGRTILLVTHGRVVDDDAATAPHSRTGAG